MVTVLWYFKACHQWYTCSSEGTHPNPSEKSHQVGTEFLNIWVYVDHFHSSHQTGLILFPLKIPGYFAEWVQKSGKQWHMQIGK